MLPLHEEKITYIKFSMHRVVMHHLIYLGEYIYIFDSLVVIVNYNSCIYINPRLFE